MKITERIRRIWDLSKKQPERTRLTGKIDFKTQLFRIRQDIEKWRRAIQMAEDVNTPDRTELIRVYKDVVLDAHLCGLMRQVEIKVLSKKFHLLNPDGEVNEDETKKLEKKWFRKVIKWQIEAQYWGHSLVELGDIVNDAFPEITLVERQFVIPDLHGVKRNLSLTTPSSLEDYTDPVTFRWYFEFGERKAHISLGLLNNIAPWAIYKKNAVGNWAAFAEIFGTPMRLGKTNITDPEMRSNMREALDTIGQSAWAVIGTEDEVELVDTSRPDAHEVYQELAQNFANSEMSKCILLQTGTTDEKSFEGSASIHENIFNELIEFNLTEIESDFNEQVILKLSNLGVIPSGLTFKYAEDEKLTVSEMIDTVKFLLEHYSITAEEIERMFGVEVAEIEQGAETGVIQNTAFRKSDLQAMYNKIKEIECCG